MQQPGNHVTHTTGGAHMPHSVIENMRKNLSDLAPYHNTPAKLQLLKSYHYKQKEKI